MDNKLGKIGFLKRFEAVVFTHAKPNLSEFLQQRRRWASKSVKYKDKKIVALPVCIWLFNVTLLINACLGFYEAVSTLEILVVAKRIGLHVPKLAQAEQPIAGSRGKWRGHRIVSLAEGDRYRLRSWVSGKCRAARSDG